MTDALDGQIALRLALKELGFPRSYVWDSMCVYEDHKTIWAELLDRKFDSSDSISQTEFESILNGFTDITDWPVSLLSQRLLEKYPSAKVILTTRDSRQAWFRSFKETIWHYQRRKYCPQGLWEKFWYSSLSANRQRPDSQSNNVFATQFMEKQMKNFPKQGENWYISHNQAVRDLVPPERLLEFNPKQGFEPLCQFLNKDVPPNEYPRSNETQKFRTAIDRNWELFQDKRLSSLSSSFSIYMLVLSGIFAALHYRNSYVSTVA